MLYSHNKLTEALYDRKIDIVPFYDDQVQPSSYDVLLGYEFQVQQRDRDEIIDPSKDNSRFFSKVVVPKGRVFELHPGDFVLGTTFETVTLGADVSARLEGKSSLGRLGLVVHSTAGFIDCGFSGPITLELSNVGTMPIRLWPGMKIGQLCFFQMTDSATMLYGSTMAQSHYQHQTGPTCSKSHENFKIRDVYTDLTAREPKV